MKIITIGIFAISVIGCLAFLVKSFQVFVEWRTEVGAGRVEAARNKTKAIRYLLLAHAVLFGGLVVAPIIEAIRL